jgi:hypothetical protein
MAPKKVAIVTLAAHWLAYWNVSTLSQAGEFDMRRLAWHITISIKLHNLASPRCSSPFEKTFALRNMPQSWCDNFKVQGCTSINLNLR